MNLRQSYARAALLFLIILGTLGAGYLKMSRQQSPLFRYWLHVPVENPRQIAPYLYWLSSHGFDVSGYEWRRQRIEVIASKTEIETLAQKGWRGQVIAERPAGSLTNTSLDPRYLNPEEVEQKLKALNAKFPERTVLKQIGSSTQGRPIWALLVSSSVPRDQQEMYQKPSVIFDGLHHAREIMTPEIVMDVAEYLLLSPPNTFRESVLQNWNIWIVPMLNVDGNAIVWKDDLWWRKNARNIAGNIVGVDINRNYPYKWASCAGSSSQSEAQDFHGPAAGSEPETQALLGLAEFVRPTASLSYHSFSELILYPYGCKGQQSPEQALYQKLSSELTKLLPSDRGDGTTYTPGAPWEILYGVDGDSMSQMSARYGATAFTFEVNLEFQPNYALKAPTLEKHRRAWQFLLSTYSQNLLKLKVVSQKQRSPLLARVQIDSISQNNGETPRTTNAAGVFFKVLAPGAYHITVTLPSGLTRTVDVLMKGEPQEVLVSF